MAWAGGALLAAPVWAAPVPVVDWRATPLRLALVERAGCAAGAAWAREVGPGYGASAAGRAAPLLRLVLEGVWPDGLVLGARPRITPTFLLLHRGVETGRIEGYAGATAFYGQLERLLVARGGQ